MNHLDFKLLHVHHNARAITLRFVDAQRQGVKVHIEEHIAVVVPAHNEASLLGRMLAGIPPWVQSIVVVDDGSTDDTAAVFDAWQQIDSRGVLLQHSKRMGVGAAIRSGYLWCRERKVDAAVVMAGDGQMAPSDLPALLDPILRNEADYAKGNRFAHPECAKRMPLLRYSGTWALTWMTRFISGYWHIFDSQSGFTVISRRCLETLPLEEIYSGYGVPNDILVTLSLYDMRVADVPIVPLYGVGECSKMRISRVSLTLSALLIRLGLKRLKHLCSRAIKTKGQKHQLEVGPAFQDSTSN